ncbi:hypothetical protein BHM03_00008068 [Ensete ventricosum]|nr:hypothetical protein BHM03_00008068 [Ensete ventricosum]
MLHPGVTQEWVDEGELSRERTKNRRWRRPYDVLAEATRGEVVVQFITRESVCNGDVTRRRHGVFVCASKLALDESLSHQHMRAVYHRGRSPSMIGATGELDYFSAHIRLRELGKSEDKAECKVTNSRAMGLAALWYRRGGTSVESSISCSHEGRALVVKGVEEVENAKANSKYQDRARGQRPRNFIRPVSMGFSSK